MSQTATGTVLDFYRALTHGDRSAALALLAPDVGWHAAHPVNDLRGRDAFFAAYWQPIVSALPDVEYRPFVRVAGHYDGATLHGDGAAGDWVCSTGFLAGTFARPLFGIPPSHRTLYLRFAELIRVAAGRIAEAYVIPDFIAAMEQARVSPVRRSLGHPGIVMPPMSMDGLSRPSAEPQETAMSVRLVLDMLDGLGRFDGTSLFSMDQERYWHPDFMWYGPGGIGTSRGLDGFRAHHQGPFLRGFPRRGIDRTKSFVADGAYVATGGWPHMTAEHRGDGWLGLAPTGRHVTMRVMDFWRRDGALLKENWVSIDVIHILGQLGLDVFDQMRELCGDGTRYTRGH
jgi:predicted ester cyclase